MIRQGCVLLVEDNADDELLTKRAFEKARVGNKLDVVRDGAEALDYLFARGPFTGRPLPVAVLLDLKLPKVDGLQVLEQMRNSDRTRHLPVIVLTSSNEENDLVRSYDIGVNSYVRKPVRFEEFVEAVTRIGLYWLLLNEQPSKNDG